jgi:chemotaxis protein MotB
VIDDEPEGTPEEGAPIWMTSFSDMMVLMLCFFVLLLSFARMDAETFHSALGSVRQALGGHPPPPSTAPIAPDRHTAEPLPRQPSEPDIRRVREFLAARGLADQVQVSTNPRGIVLRTRDQILFDSAEASLKLEGRPVLDAVQELSLQLGGQLAVEGHTDDRSIQNATFPSNWELSGARAAAVLRYLLDTHLDASRVHVAGYADTHPVASNATPEGRAQNRRVEFVFEYSESASPVPIAPAAPGTE